MKHEGLKLYLQQEIFPKLSLDLYYHCPNHTLDVYEAAMRICAHEKIDARQCDLIGAAALLHDIGYVSSYKKNEPIACEIAGKILPQLDYDQQDCQQICEMIMATCVPQNPTSTGGKILCDADLDYLGRDDFEEGADKLFREFLEHHIVSSKQHWDEIQIKFISEHRYFTEFSNLYREPEKQKHLQNILQTYHNRYTMENKKILIAVPTDFTKEAECATNHAASIAKASNGSVMLIHVLNREFKSKMKKEDRSEEDVRNELATNCDYIQNTLGVPAKFEMPEGSIFTAIGETAGEQKASLMVMGTHGVVGLEQRILGAWALRVVSDSPVPVIIVQSKNPSENGYKKIIVTADYNKESKQLAMQAISIAKNFDGEVILFEAKESDEFLGNQTKLNVQFCEKLCIENGVSHRVIVQDEGKYHQELVKKAVSENVDLICIMSRKDIDLKTVFLGDDEQWLINNDAQIPVMCVNPVQTMGITNMVLNP